MPRSNALKILFYTLLLTCMIITHASFAQGQEAAENSQEASEEKSPKVGSPIVDLIKSNQTKKSQMKSMHWSNKKYKEKMAKEKGLEEETEAETDVEGESKEDETTEDMEEELTEESKKIWKHYNSLSKRIKEKKEESNKSGKPKEDKEAETEKTADTKTTKDKGTDDDKEKKPASEGLTDILQRYKETQKEQGPMNSRSFGSID